MTGQASSDRMVSVSRHGHAQQRHRRVAGHQHAVGARHHRPARGVLEAPGDPERIQPLGTGAIEHHPRKGQHRSDVTAPGVGPAPADRRSVVEVLDHLVGLRPLLGRDDEVDVAATEAIQRLIGDAICVDVQLPQSIPPGDGGRLLLERAHGLPALQTRVPDGYRRFFRAGGLAEPGPGHLGSVRPIAFIG